MTKVVNLHRNNRHKNGYDFTLLCQTYPALQQFIRNNKFNNQPTIDFSNSDAVVALNAAILAKDYQIKYWQIPKGYLCPPIPGRVDYIHHLAELLENSLNNKKVKQHLHQLNLMESSISAVDIGTGASCIYPILGQREYNWRFVASDIDPTSVQAASDIIKKNKGLSQAITCRLQPNVESIFKDIIQKDEFYHLTLCNPPFHASVEEAAAGTQRKNKNLKGKKAVETIKNLFSTCHSHESGNLIYSIYYVSEEKKMNT